MKSVVSKRAEEGDSQCPTPSSRTMLGKRRRDTDYSLADARRPVKSYHSTYNIGTLAYHTPLSAHTSCVNALKCSHGQGAWLASGSDDRTVRLWNAMGDLGSAHDKPRGTYKGARGNIFSIAFSCDNKRIFSSGMDSMVLMHDLETGAESNHANESRSGRAGRPMDVWLDHDDAVHSVQAHPSNANLFLTASEDGTVHQYDTRSPGGAVGLLAQTCEIQDVAYHPNHPEHFVTADSDGQIYLHDARQAWTDEMSDFGEASRLSDVAVMQYDSLLVSCDSARLSTRKWANPSPSSIAFSPNGVHLSVVFSDYLPTLYAFDSSSPLLTFTSQPGRQDGEFRGYQNTTTTKHGSFGGDDLPGGRLFYSTGSDDHCAYVWEVPTGGRLDEVVDSAVYSENGFSPDRAGGDRQISFCTLDTKMPGLDYMAPAIISKPTAVVEGHRSLVNSALFHPTLPMLFTSGIEKHVLAHKATPFTASAAVAGSQHDVHRGTQQWTFEPRLPRAQPGDDEPGLGRTAEPSTAEDLQTLEYFDWLVADHEGDLMWRDGNDTETEWDEDEVSDMGSGELTDNE